MASQSYAVDYTVYVNSSDYPNEQGNYYALLDDVFATSTRSFFIDYGRSFDQHTNHVLALKLVDIDSYDIFLKVDDDDIYKTRYVESVVNSFKEKKWDFSGEDSCGALNGRFWRKDWVLSNFGLQESEPCLGMPSSWAFSRKAMDLVLTLKPHKYWFEDRHWKTQLLAEQKIVSTKRKNSSQYHYNVHGANISTSTWLDKDN